jgi:glycosyltransferase involved in cell wall biosynthesis
MSLPSLSVLIPCFNGLPFVVEAVRSVVEQADEKVECVVVDDGSSDASSETLERIFGPAVRVIRQPNAGVSVARNRALAESNGELVTWLDADDLIAPGTLNLRRVAFADDPQLQLLIGQNEVFDMETGGRVISPSPPYDRNYFAEGLLQRNLPHINALTFRRSSLTLVGDFDPVLMPSADFDFSIRAWSSLRMRFLDAVVSQQRVGDYASMTKQTGSMAHYRDTRRALLKNRKRIRDYFGTESVWRRAYAEWATVFALILLHEGRRREAMYWASKALVLRPSGLGMRPYKYLMEAVLSTRLYSAASSVVKQLGLINFATKLQSAD